VGGIGFGYDSNFWFAVGLARVKAKTLSGIRSGTQVRSGKAEFSSGMAKSLSGAVGLAGLG
jgi:hypothetical protein